MIAFDIDGVMTDYEKYVKEKGKEFFNKEIVNENGMEPSDIFDVDDTLFWKEYEEDYFNNCPARQGLAEMMEKLTDMDIKIIVITSRYGDNIYTDKKIQDMTKIFLNKYVKRYFGLVFSGSSKLEYCRNFNIDYIVEDNPKNIIELSKEFKVIKFATSYNKNIHGPNIYEASSYDDILKILKTDFT